MAAPFEGGAKHHGDHRPEPQRRDPLSAKYKGQTYRAEVVLNPNASGERPVGYKVEGKDELFKSPSAAGTAITDKACNGWAFWTVGEPPIEPEPAAKETKGKAPRRRKTNTAENGETPEIPDGTVGKHANGQVRV